MAEVFPELFGPMNTTGLPSSISTSPNRLKFRMVSFVSIVDWVARRISPVVFLLVYAVRCISWPDQVVRTIAPPDGLREQLDRAWNAGLATISLIRFRVNIDEIERRTNKALQAVERSIPNDTLSGGPVHAASHSKPRGTAYNPCPFKRAFNRYPEIGEKHRRQFLPEMEGGLPGASPTG